MIQDSNNKREHKNLKIVQRHIISRIMPCHAGRSHWSPLTKERHLYRQLHFEWPRPRPLIYKKQIFSLIVPTFSNILKSDPDFPKFHKQTLSSSSRQAKPPKSSISLSLRAHKRVFAGRKRVLRLRSDLKPVPPIRSCPFIDALS